MKTITKLSARDFMETLDSVLPENKNATVYLLTWQDGDGFLDLCADDGGIKCGQEDLFSQKELLRCRCEKSESLRFAQKLVNLGCFESANGAYRLGFDIFVVSGFDYFAFCPVLDCGYYAKLNFFERFIGFFNYKEPWDKEKFGYWEKNKNGGFVK